MAYEPKPGSFSLFKNDRRENDRQPEYKGDGLLPDGTPCWISAWVKEGQRGKFFSIAIKPKEERQDRGDDFRGRQSVGGGGSGGFSGGGRDDPFSDDIPFVTSASLW